MTVPIACKPLADEIEALEQERRALQAELRTAPTNRRRELADEIRRLGSLIVAKRPALNDCLATHAGRWDVLNERADALAMHAALLSTGQVLYFGGNERIKDQHDAGPSGWDHTRIWTPDNGRVDYVSSPDFDVFCCGHCFLGSGQLLVVGGTQKWESEQGPGNKHGHLGHFPGVRNAVRFAPSRSGLVDQLWYNSQTGLGLGAAWTDWSFFTNAANKAKHLSVTRHADGRLHAFMIGLDDQVWHNEPTGTGPGGDWSGWSYLGTNGGDKAKSLVVAPNADGRLHAFMVGLDDQVWHNEQRVAGVNSGWTGWSYLHTNGGDKAKRLVVAPNADGRLHAFMIGLDDQLWHNDQTTGGVGSAWTGWDYLGTGGGDKAKSLVVAPNVDGRLHAFMIGLDDQVWHNEQTATGVSSGWTGWSYLRTNGGDKAKRLVVAPNADGRLHAFMVGLDDQVWHNEQTNTGLRGNWTGWGYLDTNGGDRAKSLVVTPNADGRLHAFMIGLDDQVWHNEQRVAGVNSGWTGWSYLVPNGGDKAKSLVVTPNADGRLHAFMVGLDDQVWHNEQTSASLGSQWTGWNWLSSPGDKAKRLVIARDGGQRLHAFAIGIGRSPWVATPPMLPERGNPAGGGRWYPTPLTLSNGQVVVMGGHPSTDDTRHSNFMVELFDPTLNQWRDAGDEPRSVINAIANRPAQKTEIYPRLHLLPDGDVFCVALADENSWLWNPTSGFTSTSATVPPDMSLSQNHDLNLWGSVLLPLRPSERYAAKVLVAGGMSQPYIIEPLAQNPTWLPTQGRQIRSIRQFASLVLLPDGSVLMIGGTQNWDDDQYAVREAEQYNPASGTWSRLATAAVPRQYHSTALLLPDGRVWTGGSNRMPGDGTAREERMEVFSPPYLFSGPRPTIDSAPAQISWATNFSIRSQSVAEITRVVLMRCGSATHGFDADQRLVELEIQSRSAPQNTLIVTAPPNPNIAPPGYYMLFALNVKDVPSHARMVHLQ